MLQHRNESSLAVQRVSGLPPQALPLTAVWISLRNAGSHGNLSLIHKSPTPIQSNLIPPLGQAGQGPPTPHPSVISSNAAVAPRL